MLHTSCHNKSPRVGDSWRNRYVTISPDVPGPDSLTDTCSIVMTISRYTRRRIVILVSPLFEIFHSVLISCTVLYENLP